MEQKQHSALAAYFKEIIYGGIDGIVTTFAVVSGFTGAAFATDTTTQLSFAVVLLFGLANLFADAASMGLGNFLSVRSEKDLFVTIRKKERKKIDEAPEAFFTRTKELMVAQGFSVEQSETLASIYTQNPEYWADFLMQHDKEMSDPRGENEIYTGLATFFAFMVFGAIPLLPFIMHDTGDPMTIFIYSAVGTFLALVALGILKWKMVHTSLRSSLIEVVLVGGVAAVLAFMVGTFFSL